MAKKGVSGASAAAILGRLGAKKTNSLLTPEERAERARKGGLKAAENRKLREEQAPKKKAPKH